MKFKFESIEFLFSTSLKSFLPIIVIVCNPAFHHRWMQIVLMGKVLISGFSVTVFFNNHHLKFKTVFRHNKTDPQKLDFGLTFGGQFNIYDFILHTPIMKNIIMSSRSLL